MQRLLPLTGLLFVLAFGGGCGDGGGQAIRIAVAPNTDTVSVFSSRTFTATVTGTSNTAVYWTVREGSVGGSIDGNGVYTAPATPGTYHLLAISQADPNQQGVAAVTVKAGTGDFTIQ